MISPKLIFQTLRDQVGWKRSRFHLSKKVSTENKNGVEISSSDFLIPLIDLIENEWPYDIEPDPRNVGMLIELLRGCRFFRTMGRKGKVVISKDVKTSRNLGAYDTPEPIVRYITETVIGSLLKTGKFRSPPTILDPACGAGYFLIAAVDALYEAFPDMKLKSIVQNSIYGFDIDPVAVKLSKRNLTWHLQNRYKNKINSETLDKIILHQDALADLEEIPLRSVDCVIGNPPYQFYSGRGSPVKALERAGKIQESRKLADELDILAKRFPQSSIGCRDRYKWFIDRAVEIIKPGGVLGFITPNTWLQYPRYDDIRTLLSQNGKIESVIDFGSHAFSRAHVPASILIWKKGEPGTGKKFSLVKISREQWVKILSEGSRAFRGVLKAGNSVGIGTDGDIKYALVLPQAPHIRLLGDIAVLREGSHAIRAVLLDVKREPDGLENFPVLIDKAMENLKSPEIGYIRETKLQPSVIKHHQGERFLIRKTGDHLVVTPSPTEKFALGHQNVYVGKLNNESIPFLALVGILASDLMTKIYRSGPGGQKNRPMAQLRIHFLNQLPIVAIPEGFREIKKPKKKDILALIQSAKSGDTAKIEPVPVGFLSNRKAGEEIAGKIMLYHEAISTLTLEIVNGNNNNSRKALNRLVNYLYGLKD